MDNFVVTFARGFGTGGKAIASQLAKELGIHCYENRILTLASQLSGLDENVFQEVNEKLREEGARPTKRTEKNSSVTPTKKE